MKTLPPQPSPAPAASASVANPSSDWSWRTLTAYAVTAAALWTVGRAQFAHGPDGLAALTADPSLVGSVAAMLAWLAALAAATLLLARLHRSREWAFHAVVGVCLGLLVARLWGPQPRLLRAEPMLAEWAGVLHWPWAFLLETGFWFGALALALRAARQPPSEAAAPADPTLATLATVPPSVVGFAEVAAASLLGLLGIAAVMMGVFDLSDLLAQLRSLLLVVVLIAVAHQALRRFAVGWPALASADSPLSAPVWQIDDAPAVRPVGPAEHSAALAWSVLLSAGLLTVLVRGEDVQSSLFGIAAAFVLGGAATIGLRPRTAAGLDLRGVWAAGALGGLAYAAVGVHVLLTGEAPSRDAVWARPGLLTLPVDWLAAGGLGAALATRMSLAQELIWWPTRSAAGELVRLSAYLGTATAEPSSRPATPASAAALAAAPAAVAASASPPPAAAPATAATAATATAKSDAPPAAPPSKPVGKGKKKRR